MTKEIVKGESIEQVKEKDKQEEVKEETVNETSNTEKEEEEEIEMFCKPYDFRLQGDEREALLKEVKADAMKLKKELIKSNFNTLSLIQLGEAKRMFALRHSNDVRIYCNATIMGRAGGAIVEQIEETEPDKKYIALRPQQLRLVFINEVGEPKETILEGIAAAEAEKQVAREEGLMLWDIGKHSPRWDKMTEASKQRFVKEYLEELAKLADEPKTDAQKEYIDKKEEIKKELRAAIKGHAKKERKRKREIEQIKKDRETNNIWKA